MLAVLASIRAEAASYPPEYHFQTISTDRVSVHFHQGFEAMARQAATLATEILAGHEARYGQRLRHVHIVIVDADDSPNGFSSPLPFPLVTIRPVAGQDLGRHRRGLPGHRLEALVKVDGHAVVRDRPEAVLGRVGGRLRADRREHCEERERRQEEGSSGGVGHSRGA